MGATTAAIDGGGMLSNVEGYYRSLKHGRLVVLGEPGSGKTVIAIQLVLDLTAAVSPDRLDATLTQLAEAGVTVR